MAKKVKTNAMRILDSNKIDYETHSYKTDGEHVDGITVANRRDYCIPSAYQGGYEEDSADSAQRSGAPLQGADGH